MAQPQELKRVLFPVVGGMCKGEEYTLWLSRARSGRARAGGELTTEEFHAYFSVVSGMGPAQPHALSRVLFCLGGMCKGEEYALPRMR